MFSYLKHSTYSRLCYVLDVAFLLQIYVMESHSCTLDLSSLLALPLYWSPRGSV